MDENKYNASRCKDLTAYEALKNIEREEQFKKLLQTIFYISNLAGFHIEGRITFTDKRTGKIWR
jgi:hypothetical protein